MQMGVPELGAKHALYKTGNNSADMAVAWFFENMDNPVINEPLLVKKASSKGGDNIPQDLIDGLTSMFGFSEKKVRKALKKTDLNPDRAVDWLFNHPDDPDSDSEMTDVNASQAEEGPSPYKSDKPGFYDLSAFITHLGASIDAGHYVCNVKGPDGKWKYFNDAKVAETTEPPIGKGYIYFFRKRE
jgi:ubiquitin carboxyl-terminal hydrolase 5/13